MEGANRCFMVFVSFFPYFLFFLFPAGWLVKWAHRLYLGAQSHELMPISFFWNDTHQT